MRIFRFHLASPIFALALIETVALLMVPFLAAAIRFGSIAVAEAKYGPLWPRALMFAVVLLTCMLAMGLYSTRPRVDYSGVLLRMAASTSTRRCRVYSSAICWL